MSPTLVNEARTGYKRTFISNLTFDPSGALGRDGNQKLGPPAANISAPATFGFIAGQITSPRNIEFALKFYF